MLLVKKQITVGVLGLLKNLKKVFDIVRYTTKKLQPSISNGYSLLNSTYPSPHQ